MASKGAKLKFVVPPSVTEEILEVGGWFGVYMYEVMEVWPHVINLIGDDTMEKVVVLAGNFPGGLGNLFGEPVYKIERGKFTNAQIPRESCCIG